jgi:hypothetical protein
VTYGEIRYRLSKLLPGVDHDLIDGWISDRYTEILDRLKWQRRKKRSVIQTTAPYETGTITLTAGSTSVTGTGTTFTSAHTGMLLRVPHRNEWYTFTYASGTTGTLDRAFEGDTGTFSYKLYKTLYALPADCRILGAVSNLQNETSITETGFLPDATTGTPQACRKLMDNASDPPQMQIDLYPIPDAVYSLSVEYTAEETGFTAASTSTSLLPWLRPGCLVAGVEADGLNHLERFAAADRKAARFETLLRDMIRTEAANTPPKAIRVTDKFRETGYDPFGLEARKSQMP